MAVPQLPNRLLTVVFVCLEQYGIIAVVLAGLTAYRAFFNPETSVWQVSVLESAQVQSAIMDCFVNFAFGDSSFLSLLWLPHILSFSDSM